VELPEGLAGRLFLHGMPGRYEPYEDARQEIARCQIARVVCLAPLAEVKTKSPLYAQAIEAADLPWIHEMFPVADYGIPEDRDTFWHSPHHNFRYVYGWWSATLLILGRVP
jgi:hypothetical protein